MQKKNAIIITVGEKGIIFSIHTAKKIINKVFFEKFDDEVKKSLNKILAKNKSKNIYIILDILDQSFKKKSFPPMKKGDLKLLIKREIDIDPDKESLKNHIILDPISNKSKINSWQVLFISTFIPKNVKELLEYTEELPNRLVGIYLAPIESSNIIKSINKSQSKDSKDPGAESEIYCLVSQTKVSGMRQTIFHKEQILFTRLLDYDSSDPDFIKKYEKDLYASFEYLRRIFPEVSISRFRTINILTQKTIDVISKMTNIEFDIKSYTPFAVGKKINKNFAINQNTKDCDLVICESFFREKKERLKFTTKDISKARLINILMKSSYTLNLLILLGIGILSITSISKISKSEDMIGVAKIRKINAQNELEHTEKKLLEKEEEIKKEFQNSTNSGKIIEIGQVNKVFHDKKDKPLMEYIKLKFLKKHNVKIKNISYKIDRFKPKDSNIKRYKIILDGELINKSGDVDDLFTRYDQLKSELTRVYDKKYRFSINDLPKNINLDKKYHSFSIKININSK